MEELFAHSRNGVEVWYDPQQSHASTHFAKHPQLAGYVRHIIATLELHTNDVQIEHDMGEVVGESALVETSLGDEIVYARRPLRSTYSRFVKHKSPISTNWVTVRLKRQQGKYQLYTAFIGRLTPSFPGGDYRPNESKQFWAQHALVWGSQEIIPGSETLECPW